MRKLMAMLILVAGGWVSVTLPAAEAQETKPPGTKPPETKPPVGLAEQTQDLNLTDQEDSRIAEVRKEYRPKVQEAGKELGAVLKEELEKVRALLTPEQLKKVDEMKEEREERRAEGLAQTIAHLGELELTDEETAKIQEIRYEYRPRIEKVMKDLGGILTDPQKQARAEGLKAGKSRREVLASLNLTDDQKDKVAAIAQEARGLVREELDKMRAVLTEEQQAKLGEPREERVERVHDRRVQRIVNLKELNLTDDQKTKIAEIRKQYQPKVQEAATKMRVVVREELQAILAVLKA